MHLQTFCRTDGYTFFAAYAGICHNGMYLFRGADNGVCRANLETAGATGTGFFVHSGDHGLKILGFTHVYCYTQ
jgi:hypothetical protein